MPRFPHCHLIPRELPKYSTIAQVETIQETLGVADQAKSKMGHYTNDAKGSAKSKTDKPGIDVVLGSQWGDEGKGKLVDILSQVCCTCC